MSVANVCISKVIRNLSKIEPRQMSGKHNAMYDPKTWKRSIRKTTWRTECTFVYSENGFPFGRIVFDRKKRQKRIPDRRWSMTIAKMLRPYWPSTSDRRAASIGWPNVPHKGGPSLVLKCPIFVPRFAKFTLYMDTTVVGDLCFGYENGIEKWLVF